MPSQGPELRAPSEQQWPRSLCTYPRLEAGDWTLSWQALGSCQSLLSKPSWRRPEPMALPGWP